MSAFTHIAEVDEEGCPLADDEIEYAPGDGSSNECKVDRRQQAGCGS